MLQQRVMVPSSGGTSVPMDIYVPQPSREVFATVQRPAIVICPGGGYRFCSEREAEPVALRFLELGFNTFVVWYRVHVFEGEEPFISPCPSRTPLPAWPMRAPMPRNGTQIPTRSP